MEIDKQTLKDLEIFKSDENTPTVFGFIDKTKTAGGNYRLYEKFINPPKCFEELKIQQEAVRFFSVSSNLNDFKMPFSSYQMKSFEEYLTSNITVIKNDNLITCARFCLIDIEAYRYLKNSLAEIIDFIFAFKKILYTSKNKLPIILENARSAVNSLINSANFEKAARLYGNKKLLFAKVLQTDKLFRTQLKSLVSNIIEWYYEFDAIISMAKATVEYNFQFPLIIDEENCIFQIEGLYHPLVQNAVSCDISLNKDSNFVFLTGPNMAGKTTFLKAAGTLVYLSHLGMGIPAKSARISYFDRLFTSLNITDSISNGYSFFYNEVKRVKQLAESLNRGEKNFSLLDEMFRGTNVKDAYDASVMVISGLVRWQESIFILSSHLWEISDKLKVFPNVKNLCFESEIKNGKPFFNYRLINGLSDMRLGITIIENERIMDLLNTNENDKN